MNSKFIHAHGTHAMAYICTQISPTIVYINIMYSLINMKQ